MLNNIAALVGNGAAAVGDYESIQTYTVGAGGSSSIAFNSIPQTYKHLQIRVLARTGTADGMRMYYNADTGGSSANYTSHYLKGDGASATAGSYVGIGKFVTGQDLPAGASIFSTSVIDILDYTSTNKYKTFRALSGNDNNGSGSMQLASGIWISSTAALTDITLAPSTYSFTQYSSFALYGVK